MKKIGLMICLFMASAVLLGCKDDPIKCKDNEALIDGKCVVVSCDEGYKLVDGECLEIVLSELDLAIESIQEADNYQVDIHIVLDYTEVNMTMAFDGQRFMFISAGETMYFEQDGLACFEYTYEGDGIIRTPVPCENVENQYGFYLDFLAMHFEMIEDDVYRMTSDHHIIIERFFEQTLTNALVRDVMLTLNDSLFEELRFELTTGSDMYLFSFTFSQYGLINIEIPYEG